MIMVFLPLCYIIFRDLIMFFSRRSEAERLRKDVIEKERRVEKLFRQLDDNRSKLLEDINNIDASVGLPDIKNPTPPSSNSSSDDSRDT